MQHRTRIQGVDALRGLAALVVVLWHLSTHFFEIYPHYKKPIFTFNGGIFAVYLFFAISGYVIPMTLERIGTPWDFIKARFMRLYPAFIAAAITSFITVKILGLPDREISVGQAAVSLTMIAHALRFPYVDNVYWSLEVEWFFYALMVAVIAFKLQKHMSWLAAGMLIPLLLNALLVKRSPTYASLVDQFFILQYGRFFVPGICIYNWNKSQKPIFLVIVGMFLLLVTRMMGPNVGAVSLFNVIILYVATTGKLQFLGNKVLLFLGTISYSLYLIHADIGYAVMRQLLDRGVDSNIAAAVAGVIALALATALTFWVERPALLWFKNRRNAVA